MLTGHLTTPPIQQAIGCPSGGVPYRLVGNGR